MVHALGQIIEKLGIMQIVFVRARRKRRRRMRRRDVRRRKKRSRNEVKWKGGMRESLETCV